MSATEAPYGEVSSIKEFFAAIALFWKGMFASMMSAVSAAKGADGIREAFDDAMPHARQAAAGGAVHSSGQASGGVVNTVLGIGIATVVAVVITVVVDQTQSSTSISDSNLSDANNQVIGGYGDAMGLLGVVFLVLLLGVIVGALFVLSPGRGG